MKKIALEVAAFYPLKLTARPIARRTQELFALICFSCCFLLLSAQNIPHPSFRHFTTDDGLPSSEVYFILQDDDGFIWISTDNGVSRFDGYEFRHYGVEDGLLENVIFEMQLDTLGRVWMQAMSGNLYYMEGDSIKPYWHNAALSNYKNRQDFTKGFIVEGAGEKVLISTINYGSILIDKNGSAKTFPRCEKVYYQIFEKQSKLIFSFFQDKNLQTAKAFLQELNKDHRTPTLYVSTPDKAFSLSNLFYTSKGTNGASAFLLDQGHYFFQFANNGWYIQNGKIHWHHYYPQSFSYLKKMKNGQVLAGFYWNLGLRVYPSVDDLKLDKGYNILPGESVNYFMEDKEGGRWIATNDNGVFYAPPEVFLVHDKETGLSDEKVTALAIKNEKELFIGLGNGEVWHHNQSSGIWTRLPNPPSKGYIRDLYYNPESEQLWAGKNEFVFCLQHGKWDNQKNEKHTLDINAANRITSSPDGSRLWLSNHIGFKTINLFPNQSIGYIVRSHRTFITREDLQGRVWVGQSNGLFEWKDGLLQSRSDLHPAFSLRVEDIVVMSDSTIVVATKGKGVVFWKNGLFEQITTQQGLTADMMECLYADENDVVWAGTLNGLNRISGTWGKREVEQITMKHGLPSNEISRVRAYGDEVWVATNKGLVHFFNKNKSTYSPKPILDNVLVNNHPIDLASSTSLYSNEHNLTIKFFALNYKMNGKILYRYRLDCGEWVQTLSLSLNFPSLPPGDRFFEVQAQNEDGQWSESTTFNFVINPPWWASWWARTIGISTFLMSGIVFYLFRTQQLKKAHQIQIQITELERTALQAQMNPHFIFNCLNSIQNFILQNEKESAIMYLGSFAGLVRSMLNASVLGKIPLTEEVKLLNNYLKLEKLRFKNRFDYEVKTANGTDVFDIEIPPLLVQPYVENAVQHGMSDKEEGGKVVVSFKKEADYVEVSIEDNGGGISSSIPFKEKNNDNKSYGMSITQHRLELLSEKNAKDAVETKVLKDESGKISGTQVLIRIGLRE